MRQAEIKQSKNLQNYIDRRKRLWTQVRADNPTFTQAEIEARLELFGV
jgi:hypothetical protein